MHNTLTIGEGNISLKLISRNSLNFYSVELKWEYIIINLLQYRTSAFCISRHRFKGSRVGTLRFRTFSSRFICPTSGGATRLSKTFWITEEQGIFYLRTRRSGIRQKPVACADIGPEYSARYILIFQLLQGSREFHQWFSLVRLFTLNVHAIEKFVPENIVVPLLAYPEIWLRFFNWIINIFITNQ